LTFVDNAVDPTTSAIRLKSTFPNRDRTLWPGEFVQVRLQVSIDPHAIVEPVTAVQNGPEGQYVYVVSANQTVAMRPIKVGRSDGTTVVITSGLRPNEIVVTDGQLRLMPGAHVSVKPSTGGPES
jgi:multidrug efflux system membrane fusion protein